jgi:hypothetical protein
MTPTQYGPHNFGSSSLSVAAATFFDPQHLQSTKAFRVRRLQKNSNHKNLVTESDLPRVIDALYLV